MWNGLALSSLLFVVVLPGCKDKATGDDKNQTPTTDKAGDVPKAPLTPEPEPEPAPPADAQSTKTLSETAISIFEAPSMLAQPVEWHLKGEKIALRAEATLAEGATASYDTKLFATVTGAEETELFSCKSLAAAAQGRMNLVLRGDMLHVLCINAAQAEDLGSTDAKRFSFNLGKRQLEESGSYGGDGSLDLDTIDIDEGE